MLFDGAVDLCAEVLYRARSTLTESKRRFPLWGKEGGRAEWFVRTFFKEAIFIASAFLGAMYRFPFFVVEDDEADRAAFCFEVWIPFNFP